MFDFHEKRRLRAIVYSKPFALLLIIAIGFFSVSVFDRFQKLQEISAKRAEKESELATLKERATALEAQVAYLESERGIEEALRTRFDVAKEGEQVVVIVDDTPEAKADEPEPVEQKRPWWHWIWFW